METPRSDSPQVVVQVDLSFSDRAGGRRSSFVGKLFLAVLLAVFSVVALAVALIPAEHLLKSAAAESGGVTIAVEAARGVATCAGVFGFVAGALVMLLFAKIHFDRKYRA